MVRYQTNKELIFMGSDLSRPRMTVEREKMDYHFPKFDFYGTSSKIKSVRGYLNTSYGNSYLVRIDIPEGYPYVLPDVSLPYEDLPSGCPHKFSEDRLCVMKSEQWSSTLSLAFLVGKAALWLNKYDSWKRRGRTQWPGKGQSH